LVLLGTVRSAKVIAKAFGVGFQRDRPGYHAWHAACADFLRRLSGAPKPRKAYGAAIVASQNFAERAYLAGSAANCPEQPHHPG
jgi:predicted RNA polymerase sigma factor